MFLLCVKCIIYIYIYIYIYNTTYLIGVSHIDLLSPEWMKRLPALFNEALNSKKRKYTRWKINVESIDVGLHESNIP